jgi:hypothetical protein
MDCMAWGPDEPKVALAKANGKYVMYYNHWHEPAPVFAQGNKVWLDRSDITTNQPLSKLSIAIPDPIPGYRPAPPPPLMLVNSEDEYKVQAILEIQLPWVPCQVEGIWWWSQ